MGVRELLKSRRASEQQAGAAAEAARRAAQAAYERHLEEKPVSWTGGSKWKRSMVAEVLHDYRHHRRRANDAAAHGRMLQKDMARPSQRPSGHTVGARLLTKVLTRVQPWVLIAAIRANDLNMVVACVERFRVGIDTRDRRGVPSLCLAVLQGNYPISNFLIKRNADINAVDRRGNTALHYALRCGNKNIVRLMLIKHPDVDAQNDDGVSPLHLACSRGFVDVVLRMIHDHIANYALRDDHGWNALHGAAFAGSLEIVELLIKEGIRVQVVVDEKLTAEQIAMSRGHVQIARVLRKAAAQQEKARLTALENSGSHKAQRKRLGYGKTQKFRKQSLFERQYTGFAPDAEEAEQEKEDEHAPPPPPQARALI